MGAFASRSLIASGTCRHIVTSVEALSRYLSEVTALPSHLLFDPRLQLSQCCRPVIAEKLPTIFLVDPFMQFMSIHHCRQIMLPN